MCYTRVECAARLERAATKTFSSLTTELLLQVLGQSTWAMTVWVIRGDEGVGDIPGI